MLNRENNINSYPDMRNVRCESRRTKNKCVDSSNETDHSPDENIGVTYGLTGFPLASVYAPLQKFTDIYDCETGLTRGTIFSELDLPFVCGGMSGGANRG